MIQQLLQHHLQVNQNQQTLIKKQYNKKIKEMKEMKKKIIREEIREEIR